MVDYAKAFYRAWNEVTKHAVPFSPGVDVGRKDLAKRMLESGYKTSSTNFSTALYPVLHNARNKGETFDGNAKTGNWVVRSGFRSLLGQGFIDECGRD